MRFVDAHLHTDMIADAQLQKLVMMGMEAAVVPSPHMFLGSHDAEAMLKLWERFLSLEADTAQSLGFQAYASLSVPVSGLTVEEAEECLQKLSEILEHEGPGRWVGVADSHPAPRHGRGVSAPDETPSLLAIDLDVVKR